MSTAAKYIYNLMYDYYGGQKFPQVINGKPYFYDFANFTEEKMIECIEFLQKNYATGWLTDDVTTAKAILNTLAGDLYVRFDSKIDYAGIYKFLIWVYSFATHDKRAESYFRGANTPTAASYYIDKAAAAVSSAGKSVSDTVKAVVPDISSPEFTQGLANVRTILKLLPVAAVAGLIGWALLTNKN